MRPDAVTLSGGAVISSTRREEVATRVRRALLTGELRPGQRIKEVQLAEALGVSRPTLRESLQQLIHEGALVQVPYKGIHVAAPTAAELIDVAEVRVALETMAALKLARDAGPAELGAVRSALAAHLTALDDGDDLESNFTHLELHRTIWAQSGSATLHKIWPLIGSQIQMALTVDQVVQRDLERDRRLHCRLVEVIERGDEAEIVAEVRAHIQVSVDRLVERL